MNRVENTLVLNLILNIIYALFSSQIYIFWHIKINSYKRDIIYTDNSLKVQHM